MTRSTIYYAAWRLLQSHIQEKTGWGKNELATLMAECLQAAVDAEGEVES